MIKCNKIVVISQLLLIVLFMINLGHAAEPAKPSHDFKLKPEKMARIDKLRKLSIEELYEELKKDEFFYNEKFMNKAIYEALNKRKKNAVSISVEELREHTTWRNGETVEPNYNFHVAKKILQMFPEESLPPLLEEYTIGDPVTKSNIIRVMGKMAGGSNIRNHLIAALDDKTFCEDQNPDIGGIPMRICDIAYNQLVFRYKIKKVSRSIGNDHSLDERDQYIDVLKKRLND